MGGKGGESARTQTSELEHLALAWEINGAEIILSFFRISRDGGSSEGPNGDGFN